MPYFKREPITLANKKTPPSLAIAEPRRVDDAPVESAVTRAVAILDDELERQGKWTVPSGADIGESQVKVLAGLFEAVAPGPRSSHRGDCIAALPMVIAPRGETTLINVILANDTETTVDGTFVSTDFVSGNGNVLCSDTVTFPPNPLSVPPYGEEVLTIRVTIPASAPRDKYSGLLLSTSEDPLQAAVTLNVI